MAALVYQVVWQRLLGIFSGVDVYATTIVVGAFMAGLGCGSLTGGFLADRLSRQANLRMFAVSELAVGVFGAFSATLYYDVLYLKYGLIADSGAIIPVVLFLGLLWPTFFMGMSLPLLARALTRDLGHAPSTIGLLYGLNTLGAGLGALATTWWLVPAFGLDGTLRVSAAINLLVALGIVPISVAATQPQPSHQDVGQAEDASPSDIRLTFRTWAIVYGLAGLLALSLEVVWFRIVGVILKPTAFTFGTLLAIYLTGLGVGALIGSMLTRAVRRPAFAFFMVQTAIGVYVSLSMAVFLSQLERPSLEWLRVHLSNTDAIDLHKALVEGNSILPNLYALLPALLIGPPTMLMGASFPLLQKAAQSDPGRLGRRLGTLIAANIAGSTLGAILTGWLGLSLVGSSGVLRIVAAGSVLVALMALAASWKARLGFERAVAAAGLLAALVAVVIVPSPQVLWAALHGSVPGWIVHAEDASGLSVIKPSLSRTDSRTLVFVNGLSQSWLPYGDIHTALGSLPAFVHPNPKDAAVIGLGSGDTLFALAARRDLERITSIEIVKPQIATLRRYNDRFGYAGLRTLFADPRIEHISADGRLHAMRADTRFDIIEADALRPGSAYAGHLYSDRYFALLRDRLKPGGLAVTWAPTPRVRRTFIKEFPNVAAYGDILLGSPDPITVDTDAVRARAYDPYVRAYYADAGVDIHELLERYLNRPPEVFDHNYDRSRITDVNTDLFPRDEFALPPFRSWLRAGG